MRTPSSLAAAALAACASAAEGLRVVSAGSGLLQASLGPGHSASSTSQCSPSQKELVFDDLAYTEMTARICTTNWVLKQSPKALYNWSQMETVGCWQLKALNTNDMMSSGVYQHRSDGRCMLVVSGYHGAIMGVKQGLKDSVQFGRNKVRMCGYDFYEPFTKLLKQHTALANWSHIAHALGGPESTCTSVGVAAESMGGSVMELMAACANQGQLSVLQSLDLPAFNITRFFTYGSVPPAVQQIRNPFREDGCFDGVRLFIHGDLYVNLGMMLGTTYARMDAVELFHTKKGIGMRRYPCNSKEAAHFQPFKRAPSQEAVKLMVNNADWTNHEIYSYLKDLMLLHFPERFGGKHVPVTQGGAEPMMLSSA